MPAPDPWYLPYERAAGRGAVMKASCFGCPHCAPERFADAQEILAWIREARRGCA